jgi:hypothetical protein
MVQWFACVDDGRDNDDVIRRLTQQTGRIGIGRTIMRMERPDQRSK